MLKSALSISSLVATGVAVLSFFATTAMADEAGKVSQYTIKFNHVVAETSPKGMAATFFKKRAEELTNGRVNVIVLPNSKLYNDKDEIEALQLNSIQMAAPSLANFAVAQLRQFEVFDLPYLFRNMDEVHKITNGPIGKNILSSLETRGIKGLAFWDNGFKQFSMTSPIRTPKDFVNKRIRIQDSKVLEAQMRSLGAEPVRVPFSDVIKKLSEGTISGAENPVSNFYSKKMYDYQQYLELTDHGHLGYAVIVNAEFWKKLPKEIQSQLEQAMQESTEYANRLAAEKSQADLEAIKQTGKTTVIVPTDEEKAAFRKALIPVHERFEKQIGESQLKRIYETVGFKK